LRPDWKTYRHPEHHPVRFLASRWQQQTGIHLTSKELGQLKLLRKALGEFTNCVVGWILDPVNWWRFIQQVRAEARLQTAPPHPHIGFLLTHHGRALRFMRRELHHSTVETHVSFCTSLDRLRYQQMRALALVCAEGQPERLAKVEGATTLIDMRRVFIQFVDQSTATPS